MITCGQVGCLLNSGFASILCMLLKMSFKLILLFLIWPYGKVFFFCFGHSRWSSSDITLSFPHSRHGSGVPWPWRAGLQRLSLTTDAAACTAAPCSLSASQGHLGRRVMGCVACPGRSAAGWAPCLSSEGLNPWGFACSMACTWSVCSRSMWPSWKFRLGIKDHVLEIMFAEEVC